MTNSQTEERIRYKSNWESETFHVNIVKENDQNSLGDLKERTTAFDKIL